MKNLFSYSWFWMGLVLISLVAVGIGVVISVIGSKEQEGMKFGYRDRLHHVAISYDGFYVTTFVDGIPTHRKEYRGTPSSDSAEYVYSKNYGGDRIKPDTMPKRKGVNNNKLDESIYPIHPTKGGEVDDTLPSSYKEYEVCDATEVYKGKKNHGKSHCVGWITVREYKDGRKDTVGWMGVGGNFFIGDEYEKYQKLSERGKYIVDSLKEDGVTQFHNDYLTYEPIYMKPGKKIERLWRIEGPTVVIYEYLFSRTSTSTGISLIKQFEVH